MNADHNTVTSWAFLFTLLAIYGYGFYYLWVTGRHGEDDES